MKSQEKLSLSRRSSLITTKSDTSRISFFDDSDDDFNFKDDASGTYEDRHLAHKKAERKKSTVSQRRRSVIPTREGHEDMNFTMDLMMLLDTQNVRNLRKEFEKVEDGLSLHQFTRVMLRFLSKKGENRVNHKIDETEVVSNLCDLFAQIDINGDGNMEWEEFTSFIVETGLAASDHEPNSIQLYHQSSWEDTMKHHFIMDKLYYWPEVDRIGVIPTGSSVVNIFNSNLEPYRTLFTNTTSSKSRRRKSSVTGSSDNTIVLAADYNSFTNQYVISSSDLKLSFLDDTSSRLIQTITTPCSQMCLAHAGAPGSDGAGGVSGKSMTLSAGVNGAIYGWDVDSASRRLVMGGEGSNGRLLKESHTDMVLDLLSISSLECFASGSMDTTIRLWDINTGKARKVLNGHEKGVRSLAYSKDYRFLVSAGFDYNAVVWNPYVETLILRLHGHTSSLVGVDIVPNTPQIITADESGIFKVWDIRNFSCMQTFTGENLSMIKSFASIYRDKKIVSAGRKFTIFDYEKQGNPELTADDPIFAALYNPTSHTFLTASGGVIKIWDGTNGKLNKVYRGLTTSELTAVCLDDRERKFIIGDHNGYIKICDYLNGALMKEFNYLEGGKAHQKEISKLLYANTHKCVISTSWDQSICIHDEINPDKGVLLRKMSGGHESDITALAYSESLSLIASGDSDGTLNIWDYEFARLEDVCIGHTSGITNLTFLDPYPALVATDNSGNICIWAVRPHSMKYRCLIQLTNRNIFNHNLSSPVVSLAIHPVYSHHHNKINKQSDENKNSKSGIEIGRIIVNYYLFSGDEKGEIKCWNLINALTTLKRVCDFKPLWKHYPCDYPRRYLRWNAGDYMLKVKQSSDYLAFKEARKSTAFFFLEGTPILAAAEVQSMKQWRAHLDSIHSLQYIHDPPSILSASFDRLAKVWSVDGSLLGVLRQGGVSVPASRPLDSGTSHSGAGWNFVVDHEMRFEAKSKNAKIVEKAINEEYLENERLNQRDAEHSETSNGTNPDSDSNNSNSDSELFAGGGNSNSIRSDSSNSHMLYLDSYYASSSNQMSYDFEQPSSQLRRTPRLHPVNARIAGRGLSATPARVKLRLRKK